MKIQVQKIKALLTIVSALAVLILFSSCGHNESIEAVVASIDAIGEVTLESDTIISAAEEAYRNLTDKEKEMVNNISKLDEAKTKFECLKKEAEEQQRVEELKKSFCGKWVELYGKWVSDPNGTYSGWTWVPQGEYTFVLLEDGSLEIGSSIGSWDLSDDETHLITNTGLKTSWSILNENDVVKLQTVNKDITLVKAEEYNNLAEKMFFVAEIDETNISEYIVALEAIDHLDDWGEKNGLRIRFRNNKYENGYVYIGHSNDFMFESNYRSSFGKSNYTFNWPYGSYYYEKVRSLQFTGFGRAKGSITYANADFVAGNYIENGHRTIEFKDGAKVIFEMSSWTQEEYDNDMY